MKSRDIFAIKCARFAGSLSGKLHMGSGSAIGGVVSRKISPNILSTMADEVKKQVIAILGSNGKTTSTALITEVLRENGHKVFTNYTGANMEQGILSSFIAAADKKGVFDADYACIEVDELTSLRVFPKIKPDVIIITNLFADQQDRYGGVEETTKAIIKAINMVPEAKLVLNEDNMATRMIRENVANEIVSFAVETSRPDDEYAKSHIPTFTAANINRTKAGVAFDVVNAEGEVVNHINSKLRHDYNVANSMGIITAIKAYIDGEISNFEEVINKHDFSNGREKTFYIGENEVELHLVKNPAGFNNKLAHVYRCEEDKAVIMALNAEYADGEDVTWIWSIEFEKLKQDNLKKVVVFGERKFDMGVALKYNDVEYEFAGNIKEALELIWQQDIKKVFALVNYSNVAGSLNLLNAMEKGDMK